MLWGVDDTTHEIVGTKYDLQTLKKGNQEIGNWLRSLLSSNVDFDFETVRVETEKGIVSVGVLIICKAMIQTVTFEKTEYIRIGSYTKKLNEYPTIQSKLWNRLQNSKFEELNAKEDLSLSDALNMLDYQTYFDIKKEPQPTDAQGIAYYLLEEGIITKSDSGLYNITNLGAILLAKRLSDFSKLSRKAIRVVQYKGNNRMNMLKEDVGGKGYVSGFEGLIKYIGALIPTREVITTALRTQESAYPVIAIREAVANALIHQDFSVTGAGPVVEIFENRIEITNPGIPLVDVRRIIDNPPRSRNEKLAEMMRRLRICEELGTGWDKMVIACEFVQLPAPKIDLYQESTKVTLFSSVSFTNLSLDEKLWSCYLHACILHVQGEQVTNRSLRDRFGVGETSSASISRLIKEAVEANLIKPLDVTTAPRYMKYVPVWA